MKKQAKVTFAFTAFLFVFSFVACSFGSIQGTQNIQNKKEEFIPGSFEYLKSYRAKLDLSFLGYKQEMPKPVLWQVKLCKQSGEEYEVQVVYRRQIKKGFLGSKKIVHRFELVVNGKNRRRCAGRNFSSLKSMHKRVVYVDGVLITLLYADKQVHGYVGFRGY